MRGTGDVKEWWVTDKAFESIAQGKGQYRVQRSRGLRAKATAGLPPPLARLKLYVNEEIREAKRLMRRKRISRRKLYQTIIKGGATKPVYLKP